jgi:acetylornithine deacetylase/succinyl-diaminopimelate desuccinylase-like protein
MRTLLPAAILFFAFSTSGQPIDGRRIQAHIAYLAGDDLEGRGTGTEGERKANAYIEKQFRALKLKPKGTNGFDQPFEFKRGVHATGEAGTAENVIAFLDNGADKTIVIGAHYDHLGLGHDNNSLEANPAGKIHNGADDNASGVAGVIELARYFAKNKKKESNNFLFICFSGEELGLYGSKYFTEHPTIDLTTVNYMLNMDMIGRLEPSKGLIVTGTGTSPVWEPLLKTLATPELPIKTDSSGTGPSDHTSFYLKNIPALHFFTGSHSDYHKPSDDVEKINVQGQVAILNVMVKLIEELDAQPKLAFLKTKSRQLGATRAFKVTLGVMPSYSGNEEGLLVDGVTDGRPAQKAGIEAGDIIIQMGDLPIKDIASYMDALSKFEKHQTIPVKVKRKGEIKTLSVTF